jgi:hypothetical protein
MHLNYIYFFYFKILKSLFKGSQYRNGQVGGEGSQFGYSGQYTGGESSQSGQNQGQGAAYSGQEYIPAYPKKRSNKKLNQIKFICLKTEHQKANFGIKLNV